MKLSELRKNKELMDRLRWDLTPQTAGTFSDSEEIIIRSHADLEKLNMMLAKNAGAYFFVDVMSCQARLGLMDQQANGSGQVFVIEDYVSDLLEASVDEVDGAIDVSGHYPACGALLSDLKIRLGVEPEVWTDDDESVFRPLYRKHTRLRINNIRNKSSDEVWTDDDEAVFRPLYRKHIRLCGKRRIDAHRQRKFAKRN